MRAIFHAIMDDLPWFKTGGPVLLFSVQNVSVRDMDRCPAKHGERLFFVVVACMDEWADAPNPS